MQIRNGMWVRVKAEDNEERTGIVQNPNFYTGECDVDLVDYDGYTIFTLPRVNMGELRQAKKNEIPEARRPDDIKARRLGYA